MPFYNVFEYIHINLRYIFRARIKAIPLIKYEILFSFEPGNSFFNSCILHLNARKENHIKLKTSK